MINSISASTSILILLLCFGAAIVLLAVGFVLTLRNRNLHLWLDDYARGFSERNRIGREAAVTDIMVCVADHYEPRWATADEELERQRVAAWTCLLYTSPSPRDQRGSRMPSSA